MLGRMSLCRAQALALVVAYVVRSVVGDMADTYPVTHVYDWQKDSEMQLAISASDGLTGPETYTVIPLTTELGLNKSQASRGKINIQGNMVNADMNNYASIAGAAVIPYLCCDQLNDSFIQASTILNYLMNNNPQPAAIVLYSLSGVSCALIGQDLVYDSLLTMTDTDEAMQALAITNTSDGTTSATISGNFTDTSPASKVGQQGGHNSAVAMSILYSITGLITLLFLVIIATGAIRARRYPERYGPRSGLGGRPGQSRARGLARAVLETIPIIKFGDSDPPKLDPNIELENAQRPNPTGENREARNSGSSHHLPAISESLPESPAHPAVAGALGTVSGNEVNVGGGGSSAAAGTSDAHAGASNEEGLGCPICTDDFTVGEDVRVLPCNHKYHPQCIDPWLVNVSGTCPLCRLDLRPDQGEGGEGGNMGREEAPPLGADHEGVDSSHTSRRRSRLFELHRLRHATAEERIEALRRYRSEQRQGATGSIEDESHTRARLTDRLRDRFHIRTRTAQHSSSG
ncbi:E3 ubiquitin-protein ligase RNF13 [Cytospora mali]|uniref:E3 ubiquitin-protein ligase RNF13 n=1 Tax=Cytospora mali TaxID=578113 RepID=A0A194V9H9_CYTMA|nr:E3 ubiquitin-protein ligase RNF13 [Valsa mali var. pyri (nom. inval.)]